MTQALRDQLMADLDILLPMYGGETEMNFPDLFSSVDECLQGSPKLYSMCAMSFPLGDWDSDKQWQINFLRSMKGRIHLWPESWISSQGHFIPVEDTELRLD